MLKKIKIISTVIIAFSCFIVIYANIKIPQATKKFVFNNVNDVPKQKTALVLGTSKSLKNGYANPYFTYRIEAAKELYDAKKVSNFILSGDNSTQGYNEPQDMKDALISLGIPDSVIYLDYAGLRTLDSVVRAKKIFGQDSIIIVSQKFHNERAIFLAQKRGLVTYGYNAKDVKISKINFRVYIREKFARVKAFIDVLCNKDPKFLGDPITIK